MGYICSPPWSRAPERRRTPRPSCPLQEVRWWEWRCTVAALHCPQPHSHPENLHSPKHLRARTVIAREIAPEDLFLIAKSFQMKTLHLDSRWLQVKSKRSYRCCFLLPCSPVRSSYHTLLFVSISATSWTANYFFPHSSRLKLLLENGN